MEIWNQRKRIWLTRIKKLLVKMKGKIPAKWKMVHQCLQFDANEGWCKERLKRLRRRYERGGLIACEDTLREVGQLERYNNLVDPIWKRVFSQSKVSIIEFTLEFLATFRFLKPNEPWEDDAVTYRINGHWQASNVAMFGDELGLYSLEDYENRMVGTGGPDFTFPDEEKKQRKAGAMRKAFWSKISFGSTYNASKSKSTQIRDPLLRYIHRLLSHGITGRGQSEGVVNLKELWILYCIVNKHPCDIAYLMAQHIEKNAVADSSTPIVVGSWVFNLYEKADANTEGTTPGVGPAYLDLHICDNMGIVGHLPSTGDVRFQDKNGQIWDPYDPDDVLMEIEYHDQQETDGDNGGSGSGYGGRHDDEDEVAPPVHGPEFPSMLDLYHAIDRVEQRTVDLHGHTATRIDQLSERVGSLATDFTDYRTVWEERWRQDHPS